MPILRRHTHTQYIYCIYAESFVYSQNHWDSSSVKLLIEMVHRKVATEEKCVIVTDSAGATYPV